MDDRKTGSQSKSTGQLQDVAFNMSLTHPALGPAERNKVKKSHHRLIKQTAYFAVTQKDAWDSFMNRRSPVNTVTGC